MTAKPPVPSKEDRLAEALRENLKRRKQAQAPKQAPKTPDGGKARDGA